MTEKIESNISPQEENKNTWWDETKTFRKEVFDFLKDLIVIIIIVLLIRTFIILPFQISGQSMYESYYDKEFIIVDRFSYLFLTNPTRWDVVVFNTHIDGKEYFIKRIIGLWWETVKISDGKVYIKKVGSWEFLQLDEKYLSATNYNATSVRWDRSEKTYTVPVWSYFVMGDNRNASSDSRVCFWSCDTGAKTNYIEKKDITGKIFLDLWYFNFKAFSYINPDLWIVTQPKWFQSHSQFDYK
jgi:signal peptidase I